MRAQEDPDEVADPEPPALRDEPGPGDVEDPKRGARTRIIAEVRQMSAPSPGLGAGLLMTPVEKVSGVLAAPDGWCDGYGEHEELCGVGDAFLLLTVREVLTSAAEGHGACQKDAACERAVELLGALTLFAGWCYATRRGWFPGPLPEAAAGAGQGRPGG